MGEGKKVRGALFFFFRARERRKEAKEARKPPPHAQGEVDTPLTCFWFVETGVAGRSGKN